MKAAAITRAAWRARCQARLQALGWGQQAAQQYTDQAQAHEQQQRGEQVQDWARPEAAARRVYTLAHVGLPPRDEWPAIRARIERACDEVGNCRIYKTKQRKWVMVKTTANGTMLLGRLYWLVTGRDLLPGQCVSSSCGDHKCIACLVQGTKQDKQRAAAARGAFSSPVTIAKSAATRRARSRFSQDVIDDIVTSTETCTALAARHGMSKTYAQRIRAGINRRPLPGANPWAGLFARGQA